MSTLSYTNVGKFQRIQLLGQGCFGQVFKVLDTKLLEYRALKIINAPKDDDDYVKQLKEAQTLVSCRHRHVVDVKEADYYSVDGEKRVCIAYELVENGSVESALKAGKVFAPFYATSIIVDALFGMEYLHLKNPPVLHRDIKPGNLLMSSCDGIKLSDFGLATISAHGMATPIGYFIHMAPETLAGHPASRLSDIYAMGLTFYRILNRKIEMMKTAPHDFEKRIVSGHFPDRNDYSQFIPDIVRKICNKAMHCNPAKRFQTATEFRQSLERIRWGIRWDAVSPYNWVGREGADSYVLTITSNKRFWGITYLKNARRVSSHCHKGISTEEGAFALAASIIKATSVR